MSNLNSKLRLSTNTNRQSRRLLNLLFCPLQYADDRSLLWNDGIPVLLHSIVCEVMRGSL